jgi:2-iminoacetate synthase
LSFVEYFKSIDVEKIIEKSKSVTSLEIEKVLSKDRYSVLDLPYLISGEMQDSLEVIANKANKITKQRFGNIIQVYIPLYISNYCSNKCIYCGFNVENSTPRITLSLKEVLKEAAVLKSKGYEHILLLTGEAPGEVSIAYLADIIKALKQNFASVGLEVYPCDERAYKQLYSAGANSLTIYQETYHRGYYAKYHLSGKKRDYDWRLDTPDRAGRANFYNINIGALFGLYEWKYEVISLAYHLEYLQKKYWQTKFSVSVPRIQKMVSEFGAPFPVTDQILAQIICVFRLLFPDLGITLSTRESAELRDNLLRLGVTNISSESGTSPGCYSGSNAEKQFEVADTRPLSEIITKLDSLGYDVAMKDWDSVIG